MKSERTATVTYVVLRSGASELGRWVTERRDVREDFRRIYGTEAENPELVSVAIDSNDVKGIAESYVGTIRFRQR